MHACMYVCIHTCTYVQTCIHVQVLNAVLSTEVRYWRDGETNDLAAGILDSKPYPNFHPPRQAPPTVERPKYGFAYKNAHHTEEARAALKAQLQHLLSSLPNDERPPNPFERGSCTEGAPEPYALAQITTPQRHRMEVNGAAASLGFVDNGHGQWQTIECASTTAHAGSLSHASPITPIATPPSSLTAAPASLSISDTTPAIINTCVDGAFKAMPMAKSTPSSKRKKSYGRHLRRTPSIVEQYRMPETKDEVELFGHITASGVKDTGKIAEMYNNAMLAYWLAQSSTGTLDLEKKEYTHLTSSDLLAQYSAKVSDARASQNLPCSTSATLDSPTAVAPPALPQKKRRSHHYPPNTGSLLPLSITRVHELTYEARNAYDRVLGEWARQHAGCDDPPPKYNRKKHGNLQQNNAVLHQWFQQHKVQSLCKDFAVIM